MAKPIFHRGHYNILAHQIRVKLDYTLSPHNYRTKELQIEARAAITDLTLALAWRFKADNPSFEAVKWLDACSPDSIPLSELWKEHGRSGI